jgi:hypothetical protein
VILEVVKQISRLRIAEMNATRVQARMIHEETANQVIVIAQAGWPAIIRYQKQPRILNSAGGEYENLGLHFSRTAGQRFHLQRPHGRTTLRFYVNYIGVKVHHHIFRFCKFASI